MKALILSGGHGKRLRLLVYSALAMIVLALQVSSAQTVLFDSTSGFFGLESDARSGFMYLKFELEKSGFSVTDTISLRGNSVQIDGSDLKRAKVFVIVNPIREFSFSEIDALTDFVNNGGKVLIICDDPRYIGNANRIAGVFGGKFTSLYIERAEIPQYGAELKSSVPLQVEDASFTVNVTTWASEWLDLFKIGKEKHYENYTVFATKKVGKGVVAFLGDRDFMTNGNIYAANNTEFARLVFEMPVVSESEEAKESEEVMKIDMTPNEINVSVSEKPSIASVIVRNVGSNQSLRVEVPSYLEGLIVPFENPVNISSGECKILRFLIRPSSDYGEVRDYIILRNTVDEEKYIPLRVVWR
ncbi:MAG: hypothetical protein H0Z19_08140 [Archaeoglobus sp.]|uniref:DUF4350 domain-containing protein n=1 Tax=Archaeoglobus sp. TaxID=1872626 RepID=UPI001D6B6859|nr:DUF4350 domain-containing protein [Archaeoglobus sp.]MBO8180432.1 hypothetical protein [Archaeoglobus sp.]